MHWPDRTDPMPHFGRILFIHIEEMGHDGLGDRLACIIRLHGHDAAEDLERAAVPILDHVVMRRETCVDESAKILANGFPSMPIRDTEISNGIFGEAIETLAESFVVNFLPEGEEPGRRCGFGKRF